MTSKQDQPDDVGQLLKLAGERPAPPKEVRDRVYAAVVDEWEGLSQPAQSQKRWMAVAAGVVLATTLVLFAKPLSTPEPAALLVRGDDAYYSAPAAQAGAFKPGTRIQAVGIVEISISGALLRLSPDTSITVAARGHVELTRGRLYVNAQPHEGAIVVATRFGSVTDIGTQFHVALENHELVVSVREGIVDVITPQQTKRAEANADMGQQVRVDTTGITQSALPHHADVWNWVAESAQPFELEEKSIDELLRWLQGEIGLQYRYTSPIARLEAQRPRLGGAYLAADADEVIEYINHATDFTAQRSGNTIEIDVRR